MVEGTACCEEKEEADRVSGAGVQTAANVKWIKSQVWKKKKA